MGQDEACSSDARQAMMIGVSRGDGQVMPVTALLKLHVICEPVGDRHRIRHVTWIEALQLLVDPMTLDAPHRRWRILLELSSC